MANNGFINVKHANVWSVSRANRTHCNSLIHLTHDFFLFLISFSKQYGEFDCWKLECPPLTCDKPLPLAPGDCCPRCEDDPCNILVGSNSTGIYAAGKPCTYKGHEYESGQQFSDMSSQCTTCACKVNLTQFNTPIFNLKAKRMQWIVHTRPIHSHSHSHSHWEKSFCLHALPPCFILNLITQTFEEARGNSASDVWFSFSYNVLVYRDNSHLTCTTAPLFIDFFLQMNF